MLGRLCLRQIYDITRRWRHLLVKFGDLLFRAFEDAPTIGLGATGRTFGQNIEPFMGRIFCDGFITLAFPDMKQKEKVKSKEEI